MLLLIMNLWCFGVIGRLGRFELTVGTGDRSPPAYQSVTSRSRFVDA
jgi:hypothetical protein